ncbi:hypothetical protein ACS0TY_026337 [Phlomoides rotata]
MTGSTTKFVNEAFEHKRMMIWENKLMRQKICGEKYATWYMLEDGMNTSAKVVQQKRRHCLRFF